jgi:hypothetical protein
MTTMSSIISVLNTDFHVGVAMLMRAASAARQVADVRQNIEPIELCLFDAGSDVNEPLLDTIKKLFFMAWELACYAGLLVNREAAPVFARSISESAGSARRAFELRTRTVIRSDGILHEPLLRERALC